MQTFTWYTRRLRAMSAAELAWRARAAGRTWSDRWLLRRRVRAAQRQAAADTAAEPGFRLPAPVPGAWQAPAAEGWQRSAARDLARRAARLATGRLSFFDLEDHPMGNPIDWHREPKHGVVTPQRYAPRLDYRDFRVAGDAKFIWEPSRHHQLLVLARAYRATGQVGFAQAAADQWTHWLARCPYGFGLHWRSPLELAVRLINWVWTLELLGPSGAVSPALRRELRTAAYLHLEDVSRKYSRGSSANNHRIGEAAGVYIGSCYFRDFEPATRWRTESRRMLCEEIHAQTYADGGTREQAIGYHFFVLQFFLLAGLVAQRVGDRLPAEFWRRLHRMCTFLGWLGEGGTHLPMLGDSDDGYVLDVDANPHDPRPWLGVAAVLFQDPALKSWAYDGAQPAYWLLGQAGVEAFERLPRLAAGRPLVSRALPESGYYLLQCGACDAPERISVLFDCGALGFGSIAAHGHADALSVMLRAFGVDVLVDPGTYDYFSYPRWRDYFRSTRAHNTVVIDELDQSPMLGPFLWGRPARAGCEHWSPHPAGGQVVGAHDGYARLPQPVLHRRAVALEGRRRELVITDELLGTGTHRAELWFHLAENCRVTAAGRNRFEIDTGAGLAELRLDPQLTAQLLHGSEDPMAGWVSRGYHRRTPSSAVVGRCSFEPPLRLQTRLMIGAPHEPRPAVARPSAVTAAPPPRSPVQPRSAARVPPSAAPRASQPPSTAGGLAS